MGEVAIIILKAVIAIVFITIVLAFIIKVFTFIFEILQGFFQFYAELLSNIFFLFRNTYIFFKTLASKTLKLAKKNEPVEPVEQSLVEHAPSEDKITPYYFEIKTDKIEAFKRTQHTLTPIMNREMYLHCFLAVEKAVQTIDKRFRIMSEVGMSAIINTNSKCIKDKCRINNPAWITYCSRKCQIEWHARSLYSSKRFDILVIDEYGFPWVAIEYNGTGHFQSDYKKRDHQKQTVCEAMGIKLLTFDLDTKQNEILRALEAHSKIRNNKTTS